MEKEGIIIEQNSIVKTFYQLLTKIILQIQRLEFLHMLPFWLLGPLLLWLNSVSTVTVLTTRSTMTVSTPGS